MKAQNTINGYPKGFNINDSNLYSSFEKWYSLPYMKYIDIISNLGYDVDNMEKRDNKKLRDTISTIKKRVSYVEIRKDYDF